MRSVREVKGLYTVVGVAVLLCVPVGVFTFGVASARAYVLRGVACPSASQCTAIDGAGREVSFNPTAPGTPSPTTIDGSEVLVTVACPSLSQCTAIDLTGRALTFNPAAPGTPVSTMIEVGHLACPSVSRCTAVAGHGEVIFNPTAPGTPALTTIDSSGDLRALACPSVSQCTAIDSTESAGRELTFDPNAPGTPTPHPVDEVHPYCGIHCTTYGYATALTCPSVSQCTAVDDAGREVTFDPNAPGTPTPTSVTSYPLIYGGLEGVACPSITRCTAVESAGREVTFDPEAPGSPTPTLIENHQLNGVACPSPAQCTAVDPEGGEVTFDPDAPAGATRVQIDGVPPPSTSTTTTSTTSTPSRGTAEAAGSALVKRGVAQIKLTCTGSGACRGTVELLVRLTNKRAQTLAIGSATFSIAKGASTVVRVHLSRRGTALLRKADRRGLKVKVAGSDVRSRSLMLRR
jgi:hypothetical protein